MIAALLTFTYSNNFDETKIRKIAESAKSKFENMPGLRSKAFTINSESKQAKNFWEEEATARNFYTEPILELITGLYGVRPSIEYLALATLVDNHKVLLA